MKEQTDDDNKKAYCEGGRAKQKRRPFRNILHGGEF